MNPKFVAYLASLGVTANLPLFKRVEQLVAFSQTLGPELIDDLFISEWTNSDGMREWQSAWFFSPNYVMESKNVLGTEEQVDIMLISNIPYCEIHKRGYDLQKATDDSRMMVEVMFSVGNRGRLRASKSNCDSLKRIFDTYLKPNLAKPVGLAKATV